MKYDVVIAGGSIAGLLCARQLARHDKHVLVLEKSHEIGTPEHCGGLVSAAGLDKLEIKKSLHCTQNKIHKAEIYAPSGKSFEINVESTNIFEVDRRALDKQIAQQAQNFGADIRTSAEFKKNESGIIKTNIGNIECVILVDAMGVTSLLMKKIRNNVIISAQSEIMADWIKAGCVEVHLDSTKYPGFFAWVIASEDGRGKVGVAGSRINAVKVLRDLLQSRGRYSELSRISAPIWVGGSIDSFVNNKIITVGDAAGQSKPTTAGGIFSCGMGGIMAGDAIANYLDSKNDSALEVYQKSWKSMFDAEFARQLTIRKILGALDNNTIEEIISAVTPKITAVISKSDFDFHTSAIIKMLGVRVAMRLAKRLSVAEIARLMIGTTGKL